MLNELYSLAGSLSGAKIPVQTYHNYLVELPKSLCFHIWFENDGTIARIEEMPEELRCVLWKYNHNNNNGNSFPGFNLAPLYIFPEGKDKKNKKSQIQKWIDNKQFDTIKKWCEQNRNNWNTATIKRINKCLTEVPQALISPQDNNSLQKLIAILKNITAEQFRCNLESYIFQSLENGNNSDTLLKFLFAEKQSQVYLDIADCEQFGGYSVAHENTVKLMDIILQSSAIETPKKKKIKKQKKEKTSDAVSQDAFGDSYIPNDKTMPYLTLVSGFNVTLRSMFKDNRCQFRYNMISSL